MHERTQNNTNHVFALVQKQEHNPFFDEVASGCRIRATQLGSVECMVLGPDEPSAESQADIVRELVRQNVDGIAISVLDPIVIGPVIREAVDAGIPVVTYDSDAPESGRLTYVGTNNDAFGRTLGKILLQLEPNGGTFGIISDSAPNLLERNIGLRDYLDGSDWKEVSYSPTWCQDRIDLAIDQAFQYGADPAVDAIVAVGGWPMFDDNTTRWQSFVDQHRHLTLVVADTLPVQLKLMTNGYVHGLVGQVPYQMGVQSIDVLHNYTMGKFVQNEVYITSVMEMVRVPLDLEEPNVDYNRLGHFRYFGWTLFSIVAILAVTFGLWTYFKREVRVVKASQPIFLVMICGGTLLLASAIIPLSHDGDVDQHPTKSSRHCMAVPWLAFTGFTITFSALFSKTWRINKIFRHTKSRFLRMKVTERDVLLPLILLLGANILLLSLWTALAPLKWVRNEHDGTDVWNRVISTYGTCKSCSSLATVFVTLLGAINAGALIVANWQAYQARTIQSEFAESRWVAAAMAVILQAALTGVPILVLVHDEPQVYYVVLVMLIFTVALSILLLIFLPKVHHERLYRTQTEEERRHRLRNSIRLSQDFRGSFQGSSSHGATTATPTRSIQNPITIRECQKGAKPSLHVLNEDLLEEEDGEDGLRLEESLLVSWESSRACASSIASDPNEEEPVHQASESHDGIARKDDSAFSSVEYEIATEADERSRESQRQFLCDGSPPDEENFLQ